MASLRARLVVSQLKRQMKSQPLHEIDTAFLRAELDKMAPKRIPKSITLETVDEGGVRGEWHRLEHAAPGRTIFYLHGGGYAFGSAKSHRNLTFALAQACEAEVFSLDYRLAPEHPFPAAVDDARAAWRWLIDQGRDPAQTMIAGDSAGGGLALAFTVLCKEEGLPPPAGIVLFSPWTDLAVTGESIKKNAQSEAMFMPGGIEEGVEPYLRGADPHTPLASPLYADLSDLPPTLIFASADEMLLDDALRVHEKMQGAGVSSRLIVEKGVPHVWPIFSGHFPEAKRAINEAAAFVLDTLEPGRAVGRRDAEKRRMRSHAVKLALAVVLDVLDFTVGRIPGFELAFDALMGVAAVALWGWPGLFAFWELADPTGQFDGFVPTLTLIALSQIAPGRKQLTRPDKDRTG